jgi:hypothetical protein
MLWLSSILFSDIHMNHSKYVRLTSTQYFFFLISNIYPVLDPIYALTKLKMELDLLGRFLFLANEFMST